MLKLERIRAFRLGLPQVLDRAYFETALLVYTISDELVPVDTGDLQASGRIEPAAPNGSQAYTVKYGGGNVDYAEYVEYGTERMAAQPYLNPALQQVSVRDVISRYIREYARSLGL